VDRSLEYAKMCEGAVEIQKTWKPRMGDLYFDKRSANTEGLRKYRPLKTVSYAIADYGYRSAYTNSHNVWLLYQHQLQEMVGVQPEFILGVECNCQKEWSLIGKFKYSLSKEWEYFAGFRSMEQLWLAFVMYELYSKQWNGVEWMT